MDGKTGKLRRAGETEEKDDEVSPDLQAKIDAAIRKEKEKMALFNAAKSAASRSFRK